MGPIGIPELVIIFIVALVVFGPRKLPELGRSLGKGLAEFKKASTELQRTLDEEIRSEEHKAPAASTPAPMAALPPAPTAADHEISSQSETVARGEQAH